MVRHRETKIEKADERADQTSGLAQREVEHRPERQRRQNGQQRIPWLAAPARPIHAQTPHRLPAPAVQFYGRQSLVGCLSGTFPHNELRLELVLPDYLITSVVDLHQKIFCT